MQHTISLALPSRTLAIAAALAVTTATGCADLSLLNVPEPYTEVKVLAGQTVSAETLNLGREDFTTFCMHCHGALGDGKGHAAASGLWPPPRNFQQTQFKFTAVEQGELPTDDELMRIVKAGLNGTPMRAWDISDERLQGIIHYIKTFAEEEWEGEDTEAGELVEITDDPWGDAKQDEATARGEQVYHTYGCNACHPTYIRPDTIPDATEAVIDVRIQPQLRANWHRTQLKISEEYNSKVLPPDFTWHRVRTVNPQGPQAEQVTQFYRIVAAGINGAAMPAFKDVMEEDDMWALAYYMQSLTELRNSPERYVMWESIGVDPTGDVPPFPPPAAGGE